MQFKLINYELNFGSMSLFRKSYDLHVPPDSAFVCTLILKELECVRSAQQCVSTVDTTVLTA